MLTIKRIEIENDNSSINNKPYWQFTSKDLKRRNGNHCTFAFDFEINNIIEQLKQAGFKANNENYNIKLSEPSDHEVGKIVYADGFFGAVPFLVKDIMQHQGKPIAKVKYRDYPHKKSIYINIKTEDELQNEILKDYGQGMLEAYLKHTGKELSEKLKEVRK